MAQSKNQVKQTYPLPAYNFRVRIGGETHAFSKVTGLSVQYETMTYRHGLSPQEGAHYLPGILQPIQISLERGIVRSGSILLEWLNSVQLDKVKKQDITVDLCDEAGVPLVSWTVIDAFPNSMETPSFDAESNAVAIERIQLTAKSMQVSYHEPGQRGGIH